ncbi:MAG: Rieske 2Fe-2S domain-containing protein [Deltaproteobacteria bacterium]|nr:Rieske 2Fe-2S domain-containing protein [Deltaproteobacteria bacterium]
MAELDHWHPALKSEELRARPVGVTVAGRELVLFRAGGSVGCLPDRCPHRGMRLSLGTTEAGRLVCPYHGWSYAPDGQGRSPGTPTAKPCAEALETVERDGAVWVRRQGSSSRFPRWDHDGCYEVGRLRKTVHAPLEVTLDNFTEVEHTPFLHAFLGYNPEDLASLECRVTTEDDRVTVFNQGPQRPFPAPLGALYGVPRDADFIDHWTTFFSPVYTVYDQYWVDRETGERHPDALKIAVFFNPVSPEDTELFVFVHAVRPRWTSWRASPLLGALTRAFVHLEVMLDARMLGRLADRSTSLKGRSLGRFDKALVAHRPRIDALYRGAPR